MASDKSTSHFVRIDHDLFLLVEQAAKADGRSVANFISKLLNDVLAG